MNGKTVSEMVGESGTRVWPAWPILIALGLNGFAFVAVNYWIYTARAWFIATQSRYYHEPPTISRSISVDYIGEPFSAWITVSGICLFAGVAILAARYFSMRHLLSGATQRALTVMMPAVVILQGAASVGMHVLSAWRFPNFNVQHMLGSYVFFVSEAGVIVLYTIFNGLLLARPTDLARLEAAGLVRREWVRLRFWLGIGAGVLTGAYFALFALKDAYSYVEAPRLHLAYVSTEPLVISSFLLVLLMVHFDKLKPARMWAEKLEETPATH